MLLRRAEVWRRGLKRYLKDTGFYGGDTSDDRWTVECKQAWHSFCFRNNAKYTEDPNPVDQPKDIRELFELLYEYEIILRKEEGIKEPEPVKPMSQLQFIQNMIPNVVVQPKQAEDGEEGEGYNVAAETKKSIEAILRALNQKQSVKPHGVTALAAPDAQIDEEEEEDEDEPLKPVRNTKIKVRRKEGTDSGDNSITRTRG